MQLRRLLVFPNLIIGISIIKYIIIISSVIIMHITIQHHVPLVLVLVLVPCHAAPLHLA